MGIVRQKVSLINEWLILIPSVSSPRERWVKITGRKCGWVYHRGEKLQNIIYVFSEVGFWLV